MFNNTATGNFVIAGALIYGFNKTTAAGYLTNSFVSGPVVSCTAVLNPAVNCAAANQPPTPTTPDPNPLKLVPVLNANSCTFWGGGVLSVPAGKETYTEAVVLTGLNTKGSFTFTFTYQIAVANPTDPVAPGTAWDLQQTLGQPTANISVGGFFAGQSTQQKNPTGKEPWSFKTSHTLSDSSGSRVVGAAATLLNSNAAPICALSIATSITPGVDFVYAQNAGAVGATQNLIDNGAVNLIQNGLVAAYSGLTDNFNGNNATLGDRADIIGTTCTSGQCSSDLASCAVSAAGNYTLSVTATVKGVDGSASLPLTVRGSVCIQAESCTNPCL